MPPSATGIARWSATRKARCACGWACARSTAFAKDARDDHDNRGPAIPTSPISPAAPRLPARALVTLAEADAFRGFGLDRREGLWAVRRLPDDKPLPLFEQRAAPDQGARPSRPCP